MYYVFFRESEWGGNMKQIFQRPVTLGPLFSVYVCQCWQPQQYFKRYKVEFPVCVNMDMAMCVVSAVAWSDRWCVSSLVVHGTLGGRTRDKPRRHVRGKSGPQAKAETPPSFPSCPSIAEG